MREVGVKEWEEVLILAPEIHLALFTGGRIRSCAVPWTPSLLHKTLRINVMFKHPAVVKREY
jgi:hypothetical protein